MPLRYLTVARAPDSGFPSEEQDLFSSTGQMYLQCPSSVPQQEDLGYSVSFSLPLQFL